MNEQVADRLLLVRHAESVADENLDNALWPLSKRGQAQANSLIDLLAGFNVERIYSSPYVRALDTIRPFAESRGIRITVEKDLRERKLSIGMIRDWRSVIERSWQDPDFKLPSCESARDCQDRVFSCIEKLMLEAHGRTTLVSSHGNAIALFLDRIEPGCGWEQWQGMQNPHLFEVAVVGGHWRFEG